MALGRTRSLSINPGMTPDMQRLIGEARVILRELDRRKPIAIPTVFNNNADRPPARDNPARIIFVRQTNDTVAGQYSDGANWQTISSGPAGGTPTGTGFRHVTGGVEDAASKLVTLTASTDVTANQGTTTTVLHGNAAGSPSFAAVSLSADVTGTTPVANGGTGITSGTSGGVLGYTAAGTLASSAALTANQLVIGGGAGATPTALAAGTNNFVLRMGASNPGYEAELHSKDITIEDPTAAEDITFFYTPLAVTVTEVRVVQVGPSSPSLTLQLKHHTDRTNSGNNLTTSGAFSSTTSGSTATLSDDTVPAASYIWIETTAVSATPPTHTAIHLRYTID